MFVNWYYEYRQVDYICSAFFFRLAVPQEADGCLIFAIEEFCRPFLQSFCQEIVVSWLAIDNLGIAGALEGGPPGWKFPR